MTKSKRELLSQIAETESKLHREMGKLAEELPAPHSQELTHLRGKIRNSVHALVKHLLKS